MLDCRLGPEAGVKGRWRAWKGGKEGQIESDAGDDFFFRRRQKWINSPVQRTRALARRTAGRCFGRLGHLGGSRRGWRRLCRSAALQSYEMRRRVSGTGRSSEKQRGDDGHGLAHARSSWSPACASAPARQSSWPGTEEQMRSAVRGCVCVWAWAMRALRKLTRRRGFLDPVKMPAR